MTATERKTQLLGESFSKAAHKLRKNLLFQLAKQLNLLTCHQCGQPIETVDEMSIEHIEAWMSAPNPRESFYDLNNVAFSHLRCNSGAANRNAQYCEKGHLLTQRAGTNRRICPICRREYMREYMRNRRAS